MNKLTSCETQQNYISKLKFYKYLLLSDPTISQLGFNPDHIFSLIADITSDLFSLHRHVKSISIFC